jgi:uncharacterized repeat protein (TIGR01451 family)
LRVTGPDATPPGEAATLVVAVANTGDAAAQDVTLQTLLPPGLSHPCGNDLETVLGTLRPGETRQVTLTVTPTQAGEFRTRICASVAGAPAAESGATVSAPAFKLAVEANGPRLLYPGWTGTFEVFLRNDDPWPAQHVGVVVALPAGLAVSRAGDNGLYDAKLHVLRWQLSNVKPGETRTLVWSGIAREVGEQACQVQVTAGSQGRKTVSWRTTVADAPAERPAALPSSAVPAAPAPPTSSRAAAGDRNWHHGDVAPAGAVAPPALRFAPEEPVPRQAATDRR